MRARFSMMGLAVAVWVSSAAGETTVFRDGRLLPIYVPVDCSVPEREAAGELARVVQAMSGITPSLGAEASSAAAGIYVGRTLESLRLLPRLVPATDWLAPHAGEVGPDAFRIRTLGGSVFVDGATPEATYFAVTWLLQQEGGVRWYAPGAFGESIPKRTSWSLPDLDLIREPAYLSRELSGLESPEGAQWARRNGLKARLEFSHALSRVFSGELFPAHPEWFPLLWGRRYRPVSAGDRDWQPNLALPAVADFASGSALEAFSREPARVSFSLGMNDTVRFDQGPETRSLVEPLGFFGGMPDYSPLVFTFMNRAAAAVARSEPDRYLGCLAYFWCKSPPPFPVLANVIPYLAADRTQYYDQCFRAGDLDLMSRWGASGVRAFGLWDYAYGSGFVVPREPVVALADGIREGWKRGARGYFAEIGPDRGFDTFKAWAMARLLWEPSLALSDLEDDFFDGYYGAASGPMRRFHDACQKQWMVQQGSPFWLKYFNQEDQALLFPIEACVRLRAELTDAARLAAADPAVGTRVDSVSRSFSVAETYVQFDSERRRLAEAWPDEGGALDGGEGALEGAISSLILARSKLDAAAMSSPTRGGRASEPNLPDSLLRNDPVSRLIYLAGLRDPSAPRRIVGRVGGEAEAPLAWRTMAGALEAGIGTAPNLAGNSLFIDSSDAGMEPHFLYPRYGTLPAKWTLKAMPTETGRAMLVERKGAGDPAPRGRCLRIEGAWDTQLYQWLAARPGSTYLATARLRGLSSPGCDSALFLTFLSGDGRVLAAWMQALPKGETRQWRTQALCDRAPSQAAWVGIGIGCSRQAADDWMEAGPIELRSVASAPPT